MAEILNLRRARKAKERAASEKNAAENRSRFGRTKAERENADANAVLDTRRLEAHRRQPNDVLETLSDLNGGPRHADDDH